MKRFKKIYIEITNSCNLNCSFCSPQKRQSRNISVAELEQIALEITPYTDYVYLHIKGEPLLHPQLNEILAVCLKYNLKVNIVTNGTLIGKDLQNILLHPTIRQINISLHCFDELKHKQQDYLMHILDYTEKALSTSQIIISLRLWTIQKNELSDSNKYIMKEIGKRLNESIDILEIPFQGIKLRDRLYLNFGEEFEWPSLQNNIVAETGFCMGLRDQIGILADGTVVPCCLDAEGIINLGNIFTNSLHDIITSEKAKTIFENFSNNIIVEDLCKRCRYRKRFD